MSMRSEEEYLELLENDRMSTIELAENLDITRRGAQLRLEKLVENGLVEKEIEGRAAYWSLTEQGREKLEK